MLPNVKTSPTFASEGGREQNDAGKSSYYKGQYFTFASEGGWDQNDAGKSSYRKDNISTLIDLRCSQI